MTQQTIVPMTSAEAAEFAPMWGSLIRNGDPGACMYGFSGDNGQPQNEQHRQSCISYMEDARKRVENNPENWDDKEEGIVGADEIKQIDAFLAWIRTAPIQD